jgi:hypothetical protein
VRGPIAPGEVDDARLVRARQDRRHDGRHQLGIAFDQGLQLHRKAL